MKFFPVFLFLCSLLFFNFFFSCSSGSFELWVDYADFPDQEKAFLAGILDAAVLKNSGFRFTDTPGPETVVISFERRQCGWKNGDMDFTHGFLPFSRICMVYPSELWENKSLNLEDITDNRILSDLIPLSDLEPPNIALKINGYDISDSGYPLVYENGIRFNYKGQYKKRADEKIAALMNLIQSEKKPDLFCFDSQPQLFRIAAGGDVMLARGVEEIFLTEGPEGILGSTAALVNSADLSIINLEGAITGRGKEAEKTYIFRFDPRVAPALKNAGFDAVLFANNHAFDFGMEGFLDTVIYLEEAGLGILGAGRNAKAAAAPFFIAGTNMPIMIFGIASYGRERSGWDGLAYAADEHSAGILHAGNGGAELIRQQLDKDALNIIFYHGGIEYADYPDTGTRTLYTGLVQSGADLVIGTHPHVEQGFEWVEGKPVFWSLGDYVFDEMDDTPGGDKGLFIVLSYLGKTLVHIDLYPVFMDGPRTVISLPEQLERFFRLTKELSQR